MTISREKFLLTLLAEEAAEVAQAATKAIRFGLQEVKTGQDKTNAERIRAEFYDLCFAVRMLEEETTFSQPSYDEYVEYTKQRAEQFQKYYEYSRSLGEVE